MPIVIKAKTYRWLHSLGILRHPLMPVGSSSTEGQIAFDEENYLRNGYLISVLLRKFVETFGEEYNDLLKVRKLATIKES